MNESPQPIEVRGRQLTCPVCSNQLFWSRQAQLILPWLVFSTWTGQIAQHNVLYAQNAHIFPGFLVSKRYQLNWEFNMQVSVIHHND
jgi:hypothetical protein